MKWFKKRRIFLDYASATPVLPEVKRVMKKYWSKDFYNPLAIYQEGLAVKSEVEKYRAQIAKFLSATKEGVIFTSGGTEANILAIQGISIQADKGHIIVDRESHPSVLSVAEGIDFSLWKVGEKLPIKKNTMLITSPTTESSLGRLVRKYRREHNSAYPLLHIDASGTFNYSDITMEKLQCDLITLNSSKIYGPKGVGALVTRRGVRLHRLHQGTLSVPLIAGFAKAMEIAVRDRGKEARRLRFLRQQFVDIIKNFSPEAVVEQKESNIVNISFPNILPELLVLALDKEGVLVSHGPACESNHPEPSDTPIRISFGRFTTEYEVNKAAKTFCLIIQNMIKYQK